MAWFALGLYLVWIALAFGARSILHRRRTGDSGWRRPTDGPRTIAWWASGLFAVALVAGVAAPIAELAGLDAIAFLDSTVVRIAGTFVAVMGVAATLLTQASMGDAWRIGVQTDVRTRLVTNGPFRYVRNPIFTAMIATAVGLAMIVPNLVAISGLAALAVAVAVQVRVVEEPYLLHTHRERYLVYASRAGRFIPGVGRLRASALTADTAAGSRSRPGELDRNRFRWRYAGASTASSHDDDRHEGGDGDGESGDTDEHGGDHAERGDRPEDTEDRPDAARHTGDGGEPDDLAAAHAARPNSSATMAAAPSGARTSNAVPR
ncbi:MAG: methyltransferase family protein [Ilumatobacteraceae bacterium]